MIEPGAGSLLDADAEALVNTVNCVGIMGKGVALLVKQAYPENFARYQEACAAGEVKPGRMLVVSTGRLDNPCYIINFPTKRHWKAKSRLEYIREGLPALIAEVERLGVRSIAVPALGCGNGGLNWDDVRPLIEAAFAAVPNVRVVLFDPLADDSPPHRRSTCEETRLTIAQASILRLMECYRQIGRAHV